MENKKILLFLTGCINPNGMGLTLLQDSAVRRTQYISAIKFYLKKTNVNILFVENSGEDISNEFVDEIRGSRLEVLTFNGNNYERSLGKGYGEMAIIQYALAHSTFFLDADFIYKITGRYKINNIQNLINQYLLDTSLDIVVNLRKHFSYAESIFFGATKDFYSYLVTFKQSLNDTEGRTFEKCLCYAVLNFIIQGAHFSLLKHIPRITAVSGTNNIPYNDSLVLWFPKNIVHRIRFKLLQKY